MDKVLIEGLSVETVIGVLDWEREIKQRLVFDLELSTDIQQAGATDDLQYAIDYAAVSQSVLDLVEASSYQLIESLAEKIAAMVLAEFNISHVKLKVSKPGAVPQAQNVAVQIERSAS